jgi:hypothetical protein
MGPRFFERNIRAALAEDKPVNRSIKHSIKRIVIDGTEDTAGFAFNHNGVTFSAEALNFADGKFTLTEPRLLNGAQTVTTWERFLKANEGNTRFAERLDSLEPVNQGWWCT